MSTALLKNDIVLKRYKISEEQIQSYYQRLVIALKQQKADIDDFSLISTQLIINSILNHRNPEDVAWAILQ